MDGVTRRIFLRRMATVLGAAAGSWLLNACGVEEPLVPATGPASTQPSVSPIAEAGETPQSATAEPATTPEPAPSTEWAELAVARGGEPRELVRRALTALGGMEQFVSAGDDVIVKPNICVGYHTFEYAATTNPWVVGALVELCLQAGARRVRVMDFPFGGDAQLAYEKSGIREQVEAAGGEMEIMAAFKFVETEIPQGQHLTRCDIYDEVLNADLLINVPIAKHHSLARLTLGMKNLMGVIYDRPAMHSRLGQRLADLTSRVRPALTVVDAVRVLVANGPSGGSLDDVQKMDTVIASPDIVAADTYAASLMGVRPDNLTYIQAGVAMGLGRSDLDRMRIEEITVGG